MSEQLSVAKDIKALALINIQDIFRFTITATDKEIEDRYGSEARAIEVAEKYLEIAMRTSVLEYDLKGWSVTYSVPIKDKNERIEKTAYFYDKADRKTESNSEKPNNSTISKMEQVEQRSCDTCKGRDIEGWRNPCIGCTEFAFYEPKDELQYDIDKGTISCDNCAENGSYKCSKCDGEIYFKRLAVENEPQTEDEVLREQVRAFMGIVEQMEKNE